MLSITTPSPVLTLGDEDIINLTASGDVSAVVTA